MSRRSPAQDCNGRISYTPTTTFGTFPFPPGLSPDVAASTYAADPRAIAIAAAARRLAKLRDRWLHPPEWVDWIELHPDFPMQPVSRNAAAATELKGRTLTRLYNARPQWLADVHGELDSAVAAAYGWDVGISSDEALHGLLELNASRPD